LELEINWDGVLVAQTIGSITYANCSSSAVPHGSQQECECEQSIYWSNLAGNQCNQYNIMYWYHPNYLGSVEFVTDNNGAPYQFFFNTPFGENLENQFVDNYRSFESRFRFNGKEWDEETGNYYYGARYYDPKISVWLSVDPLAHEFSSWTPYHFVHNNPLNLIDPTGMSAKCESCPEGEEFNEFRESNVDFEFKPNDNDGGEVHVSGHQSLDEVVVTAPAPESLGNQSSGSSGSIGSGISIFGSGSNGVDNWNSGLNPLFSIDMTDPFWSAFFGWGQKGKYNDAIPGSDWSDDVKDMTKPVTDVVQVAEEMESEGRLPVAPVPQVSQPVPSTRHHMFKTKYGKDGINTVYDTTVNAEDTSKLRRMEVLKSKRNGH